MTTTLENVLIIQDMSSKLIYTLLGLILLVIAVEGGYYWAIKRSSRVQPAENILNQLRSDSTQTATQNEPGQPTEQLVPLHTVPTGAPEEEKKIKTYLDQVKSSAKDSNAQAALGSLGKGADIKLSQLAKAYQERKMEITVTIPVLPDNPKLTQSISEYLQNFNAEELTTLNPSIWAKPFYMLGLIAYRNNEPSFLVPVWKNAISLAPEWSFFYVELANYYSSIGKTQEAKDILNGCTQFNSPKFHCKTFMDTNLGNNKIESIGFLEETIVKELY